MTNPISAPLIDRDLQWELIRNIRNKEITTEQYREMLKQCDIEIKKAANDYIRGLMKIQKDEL